MNNAEFQEFYEKYYEFSTRIANKIVKSHVVAEDISQETFFNLYKIKDALDCSSELRLQGLVAKAVVNKARDYLRKNYTKREIFQMDQIGQEKYLESVEDQFLDVEKKKYMFKALENLRKKNKKNKSDMAKTNEELRKISKRLNQDSINKFIKERNGIKS